MGSLQYHDSGATHTGDCAVPENAQRQRSDAVAKAMRSDTWRTLTNA